MLFLVVSSFCGSCFVWWCTDLKANVNAFKLYCTLSTFALNKICSRTHVCSALVDLSRWMGDKQTCNITKSEFQGVA